MLGAIIGDVVGSRFEFNNIKTKDFKLLDEHSMFTDDTVLTVAVMDWLLHAKERNGETAAKYLQKWARKYPYAGYGGMFSRWKDLTNPKPYNSCGNGSAMRISGVGWIGKDAAEVMHLSNIVTGVTHNHPEGMKGAFVTAELIYLARTGSSKEEMKAFAERFYNLDFNYDDLVANYKHEEEICQNTVPQAIYCFLISNSFEDCLRTTISIGGDCDTTAAISCAIAEAYYAYIPDELFDGVYQKLTPEMREVVKEFIDTCWRNARK